MAEQALRSIDAIDEPSLGQRQEALKEEGKCSS
jgi:hypothetical protein